MRLFVAVVPDGVVLDGLAVATGPLRDRPGGPRWAPREQWHITLAFLGEVPERRVGKLVQRLAEVPGWPFRLRLSGAGTFPPRGAPRVLWAGLAGDLDRLGSLARAVRRIARAAGVPVERRPYSPHLTLGRWRPGDPTDPALAGSLSDYDSPQWTVGEFVLIRSNLNGTPRYEKVQTYPLSDDGRR